jgi:hypothetical protein
MAKKTKANRRLTEELLETARDMQASGLVSTATHKRITVLLRHSASGEPYLKVDNGES